MEACKGVNIAIMVGGFPRKEGMERKDVMSKNVSIYKSQASALEEHAAKDVKVRIIDHLSESTQLVCFNLSTLVYYIIWGRQILVFYARHVVRNSLIDTISILVVFSIMI